MRSELVVPPHLDGAPWLMFEQQCALSIYDDIKKHLPKLAKKTTVERVHATRVALRRWSSIWKILDQDGWNSSKYWKQVGKELKKIRSLLGELRDCDVNIEVAESVGVSKKILDKWHEERKSIAKKTKKELKGFDVDTLLDDMKEFLLKRPDKLRKNLEAAGGHSNDSAYLHLEPFVQAQEEITRNLASSAKTPEELHALRLGVKAWRYLLVEFYGLTNLELVKAQSILGKLNDLHRVELLLADEKDTAAKDALAKCNEQREKLLDDFTQFRENLPYGLRPSVSSPGRKLKSN